VPTVYLLSQAAGAALVLYRVEFYTVALAMHYVEYHLIMMPRCFSAPLDETSRVDGVMAWLRRHKPIFYAALLGLALWVTVWSLVWARQPDASRIHAFGTLFNGIFLVHFFIEAFIWKFSNPYFRRTLAPLYFPSRPKAGEAA
jgi:drug/metabolite transporter superfamily protein YnfA